MVTRLVRQRYQKACLLTIPRGNSIPLRLVSIFLNNGHVDIYCGKFLANTFFVDITIKLYYCQKTRCFKFNFRKNNLHNQKARKKINITRNCRHGYLHFLNKLTVHVIMVP